MEIEITLKGYRCFGHEPGATFTLKPGVTAFLGMNNAGKSAILRFVYEFRHLFRALSHPEPLLAAIRDGCSVPELQRTVRSIVDMLHDPVEGEIQLGIAAIETGEVAQGTRADRTLWLTIARDGSVTFKLPRISITSVLSFGVGERIESIDLARMDKAPYVALARAFGLLAKSLCVPADRQATSSERLPEHLDLHVGAEFISKWSKVRAGRDAEQNRIAHDIETRMARLLGIERFDAVRADDENTLSLRLDGRTLRLNEVGRGVTHLMMVLTTAAIHRPPFILIDEPECGLHPALQMELVRDLRDYATEGVVMTTHSVGLARAVADYAFVVRRRKGNSEIEPANVALRLRPSESGEPSAQSAYDDEVHAALGYHTILLVEGPTEVESYRHWLGLFGAEKRVAIIHLGGGQTIGAGRDAFLREFVKVTPNVHAIIDSERKSAKGELPSDRTAFVETCEYLGIQCLVTERRALENYFPEHAVKKLKGQAAVALGTFEKLNEGRTHWPKDENARIASYLTKEDLAETDIGRLLARL